MNRFDLEEHINNLYSLVDSLNDISYGILEGDLDQDETTNAIDGLAVITKLKIEKLFDIFVQVFNLKSQESAADFWQHYAKCNDSRNEWK